MAETYRRMGRPDEEVRRVNTRTAEVKQVLAIYLIVATFGEREGAQLTTKFVLPYVAAAFEQLFRRYKGETRH